MGLVVFGAIALYFIVSIAAVSFAAKLAKRHGASPWRWGGGVALLMYLVVFWDHVPTVLVHRYYCEKEAGFWVYKTVERWNAENPGVANTLTSARVSPATRTGDMKTYVDTTVLNQRFNWVAKKNGPLVLNRWRWEKEIVDTKTNEVLARYIDFSTGSGFIAGPPQSLKFWLQRDHCIRGLDNMYSMDAIVGNMSRILKAHEK